MTDDKAANPTTYPTRYGSIVHLHRKASSDADKQSLLPTSVMRYSPSICHAPNDSSNMCERVCRDDPDLGVREPSGNRR